ncbi:MAG: hypothetical protein WAX77_05495 [Methylococcaceae bacterium]
MTIQKQFILRYKEFGHVRFEIPALYTESLNAKALSQALTKIEGVYRVKVFNSQQKLSIRYNEYSCDFTTLVKALFQIITELESKRLQEQQSLSAKKARVKESIKEKVKHWKVSKWFKQRVEDAKDTVQAAKIVSKIGLKKNKAFLKDPEKTIIDFLNDVLTLFLIRLHWDHIVKLWIPNPFKYRNEWLAVFYMIFLLMRSRRPK